jgi:1,2-diacylglycerol 3-alpha-glucosyltransferase
MKIAMVTDAFNNANGCTVTTMRLVEGLRKRGHEFNIVAATSLEKNFFKVKKFYLPPTKEAQMQMDCPFGVPEKKVLRMAFQDADIVQIQFPFYLGYGAAKIARAMRKPIIGGCHMQPQNFVAAMGKESKFMEYMVWKAFNFILFNRATMLHCPSPFAEKLFKKNGVKRPIKVVSNGIPTEYTAKEYSRPDFFGDYFVIVTIGRHAPEKRQMLLIEALKLTKHADRILLMVCGKGECSGSLIKAGADLPVKPFIRYITNEEKLQFLNTADLYVLGSLVELESLSCLEAIGCGLPCLIGNSPYSAAPQFALDDRFIFNYDNAAALAEKIDYWFENREELKNLRLQVLAMAEKYRFETCLDQMEQLYEEAIRRIRQP